MADAWRERVLANTAIGIVMVVIRNLFRRALGIRKKNLSCGCVEPEDARPGVPACPLTCDCLCHQSGGG